MGEKKRCPPRCYRKLLHERFRQSLFAKTSGGEQCVPIFDSDWQRKRERTQGQRMQLLMGPYPLTVADFKWFLALAGMRFWVDRGLCAFLGTDVLMRNEFSRIGVIDGEEQVIFGLEAYRVGLWSRGPRACCGFCFWMSAALSHLWLYDISNKPIWLLTSCCWLWCVCWYGLDCFFK